MKTISKNGFKIAASGTATQIVLLCHGGWVEGDGVTTIPSSLRVCFYAGHGHFTIGASVYSAVCKAGVNARGGLLKQIALTDEELGLWAASKGMTVGAARDEQLKYATGVYDSFGGGNPMFDYALSREPKGTRLDGEKRLFDAHRRGGQHHDIDMMVMTTGKGRHLSDVFKIVKDRGYTTLHFGACRVSYGASPSEVST